MDILLQQIINGLVIGSIYALVALGYTMVYGILQVINFAHGEVVMMSGMFTLSALQWLASGPAAGVAGPGLWLMAAALALPPVLLLGYGIERIAYRPLRHAPRLAPLITAIGVSIVLQQVAVLVWKSNPRAFPDILPHEGLSVFGAIISPVQVAILCMALLAMASLWLLVEHTRLGRAMRAVAHNPAVAGLMGVPVDRIILITFLLGAALAWLAGVMLGANYGLVYPSMGFLLGLKAFTAAVLGGIGNLAGAMLGGLLLGLVECIGAAYLGPLTGQVLGSHYQDIFAFLVLIGVLVLRPSGLLGERLAERA